MTKRLLYLNGLAILMIPLQHATAYGLQAMFQWTNVYLAGDVPNYSLLGTLPYHLIIIFRQISTFSVPSFLFISGFFISFLARGKEAKVSWSQVLPRVKVLLYPFAIWTVIRYVLLRQWPTTLDDILNPYHFVPLLCQFYLISPFLVPLARDRWKLLLTLAAILHLGVQLFRYTNDLGMAIPGQDFVLNYIPRWLILGQQPFWFPLGMVFGLHVKDFSPRINSARGKLLIAALAFLALSIAEYYIAFSINGDAWQKAEFVGSSFSGLSRNFYILFSILFILSLEDASLPYPKLISDLGAKSLGVYMANIPAIYVVAVIMYRVFPSLLGYQIIYVPVLFAAGLGLPLLFMWIVKQTPLRVAYRYLFG